MSEPPELPQMAVAATAVSPAVSTPPRPTTKVATGIQAAAEAAPPATPALPSADNPTSRPSWSLQLSATPRALALSGGTVVVSLPDALRGYSSEGEVWARAGASLPHVLATDGTIVSAEQGTLFGIKATSGANRFEVALPAKKLAEPSTVVALSASASASAVLAVSNSAHFYALSPDNCANDGDDCLRPLGHLRDEFIEPTALVVQGESGTRYLAEEDSMRAFDMDFRTTFALSASANIAAVVPVPGNRALVQFGEEAALLDTESCRGRAEVQLLPRGATNAPRGCVRWRYGRNIEPAPPAAIDTASIALNEAGKLQVVAEGDDTWKSPLETRGPVLYADNTLYTLASGPGGMALLAVDAVRGTVSWRHPLGIADTPTHDEPIYLRWERGWVAASVGSKLTVVQATN